MLHIVGSGWSGLRVCVFYINLGSDLFKIFAYLAFFSVVYSVIGIPLHIIGDVYVPRFPKCFFVFRYFQMCASVA